MKGLIFTYLLTFGGAAASLYHPFIGLLVYISFAIIQPEATWFWAVPAGNYSRIVAVALLSGWALRGFGRWKFGTARAIVAALLGYLLWSVVGATLAVDQSIGWAFVETLLKIVLPFLVGITTIDSVVKLRALAWVIVVSQGYVAYELNASYYQGYNRVYLDGFNGMDNNCVAIAMVTCVGLAFFLALQAGRWWQKVAALVCGGLMAHVVMFSYSRGGMLALIVTGFVAFLLIPKRPRHYLVFAAAAALMIRLAGPEVLDRFSTTFLDSNERDASAQSRLELWTACWDTMLDRPVLGVGPDHWPLVVDKYGFPRGKEAHTLWLQIGAELGFPGLLCLALFYALCVKRLLPLTRERLAVADPWFRDSARMVIASLVGFAVSAQFVSLEGLETPYYVVLLGTGALKLHSLAQQPDQLAGVSPGEFRAPLAHLVGWDESATAHQVVRSSRNWWAVAD
ncbi:MAG: O-antigen ligase family protein [Planctomycetes bacterium]|nr:O-antigen ligase family protein [Planctomycetota bacterium]